MRKTEYSKRAGFAALAATVLVTGCATPSSRIATALTRYGLDPVQSRCVGDRLDSNLSIGQLQQLGRAARAIKTGDTMPGRLTSSDLLRLSAQIDDVKIPIEVAKATTACSVFAPGSR